MVGHVERMAEVKCDKSWGIRRQEIPDELQIRYLY